MNIANATVALQELTRAGLPIPVETQLYVRVALEQTLGRRHCLAFYVKELKVPFSTLSRLAWQLYERGLVRYESDENDRRKKRIVAVLSHERKRAA